jgi:hypothetical protein
MQKPIDRSRARNRLLPITRSRLLLAYKPPDLLDLAACSVSTPDQFIPLDGFSKNAPPKLGARFIFRASLLNAGRAFGAGRYCPSVRGRGKQ